MNRGCYETIAGAFNRFSALRVAMSAVDTVEFRRGCGVCDAPDALGNRG